MLLMLLMILLMIFMIMMMIIDLFYLLILMIMMTNYLADDNINFTDDDYIYDYVTSLFTFIRRYLG